MQDQIEQLRRENQELVEALADTLDSLHSLQTACALSGMPAKVFAGLGGKAVKALAHVQEEPADDLVWALNAAPHRAECDVWKSQGLECSCDAEPPSNALRGGELVEALREARHAFVRIHGDLYKLCQILVDKDLSAKWVIPANDIAASQAESILLLLTRDEEERAPAPTTEVEAELSNLRERIRSAHELQQLTQDNQVRWMQKHDEVLVELKSLLDQRRVMGIRMFVAEQELRKISLNHAEAARSHVVAALKALDGDLGTAAQSHDGGEAQDV